jgi:hypothetical protein
MNLNDEFLVFTSPHPAGNGKRHWAGAQRPKAGTSTAFPAGTSANDVYTHKNAKHLALKLRQQAVKLGLIPGSPRWRAYVLGTLQASKRRKRKKRTDDETGLVTPGK